jgi:rfaE bifunctional protein kinase chain/domain
MILVIGDLILDIFSINKTIKKSPEANVPVVRNLRSIKKIGGAGNVINNVNQIDKSSMLISRIGNNENDKFIIKFLKNKKIKNKLFYEKKFTIGKKTRFFLNGVQKHRLDDEIIFKVKKDTEDKIFEYIKKNLNKFSLLIVSDYKKGLISRSLFKKVSKLFLKKKKYVITNPKQKDFTFYQNSTIIVPNEKEFNNFFNKKYNIESKINFFFKKSNIDNLIITRGSKNLLYVNKNKKKIFFNIKKIKSFDVTGASDTFMAFLGIFLKRKLDIETSIKISILAATKVVTKNYTEIITRFELAYILKHLKLKF